MSKCPLCNRRVWTLKAASVKPCCDECERTTREDMRVRLASVNEHWGLFRRSQDKARALTHLDTAIGHARVLNSYHQSGLGPIVPSPPQVLDLLEGKKRRVAAHFQESRSNGKSAPRAAPRPVGENISWQAALWPEQPPVIYAGPPEPEACDGPATLFEGNLSDDTAEVIVRLQDRSCRIEEAAAAESGRWLAEKPVAAPEAEVEDLLGLCHAAARADRRERRRLEPFGLVARIAGLGEPARVTDLSLGGISLVSPVRRKIGNRLKLVIDGGGRQIEAVGVIRWTRPNSFDEGDTPCRMGLQFVELSVSGPAQWLQ